MQSLNRKNIQYVVDIKKILVYVKIIDVQLYPTLAFPIYTDFTVCSRMVDQTPVDRAEDPFSIFKSLTGKMVGYLKMWRGLFNGFHRERIASGSEV